MDKKKASVYDNSVNDAYNDIFKGSSEDIDINNQHDISLLNDDVLNAVMDRIHGTIEDDND